jgi:hypothetical protein
MGSVKSPSSFRISPETLSGRINLFLRIHPKLTLLILVLIVTVPKFYRSGAPWFDSRALQEKKVVSLVRGPLSLVSTAEELTE